MLTTSPNFCGAMVTKGLGDCGRDLQRRSRHRITNDADVVVEAEMPLVELIAPMRA